MGHSSRSITRKRAILLLAVLVVATMPLGACRARETDVPFETLDRQNKGYAYLEGREPRLFVIAQTAEVEILGDTVTSSAKQQLLGLDYDQCLAVAVFQGHLGIWPYPEPGVQVQRVTVRAEVVTVYARLYEPVEGYEQLPTESSAYEIIRLRRSDISQGEVGFVLSVGGEEVIKQPHSIL